MQLEDPAFLSKLLGRGHIKHDGDLALHPVDFARQCVNLSKSFRENLSSMLTLFMCMRAAIVATDQVERGQLFNVATKFVMKFMWLDRISGPDLMVAINVCAGHFTQWTFNDAKRMTKLACYVAATLDHCYIMQIHDNPSDLRLSLYADVGFGSAPVMKSTSGCLLTLGGLQSFAYICFTFVVQQATKLFPNQLRNLHLYRFLLLLFMRLFRSVRFARSSSSTKWFQDALRTTQLFSQSLPVVLTEVAASE